MTLEPTLHICDSQGSVVVFTSYSSWTFTDPASEYYFHKSVMMMMMIIGEYYCHKTPMLFAFILLLIKWLLVPTIMVPQTNDYSLNGQK